jgi:hypothetical protein
MPDTDRHVEAICTMSMPTHCTGSVRCGHDHPSEAEAKDCIDRLLAATEARLLATIDATRARHAAARTGLVLIANECLYHYTIRRIQSLVHDTLATIEEARNAPAD